MEEEMRGRVRTFIHETLEDELSSALRPGRCERADDAGLGS
ncbi:MAG: hypothetical protein AAGG47_17380 [Pseudomonadota bacterium]